MTTSPVCPWCGRPFRARRGGSAQRFLPCQVQNDVLVSPAPLGRALGRGWYPDRRRHQERHRERRCASVHASSKRYFAFADIRAKEAADIEPAERADEADDLFDDFLISLLELPGNDPSDIAVALLHELYDRIDRYLESLLSLGPPGCARNKTVESIGDVVFSMV